MAEVRGVERSDKRNIVGLVVSDVDVVEVKRWLESGWLVFARRVER